MYNLSIASEPTKTILLRVQSTIFYFGFFRAAFPKAAIKRLVQSISGCSVSQNVVIAISGIAKVFVGEIVEKVRRLI